MCTLEAYRSEPRNVGNVNPNTNNIHITKLSLHRPCLWTDQWWAFFCNFSVILNQSSMSNSSLASQGPLELYVTVGFVLGWAFGIILVITKAFSFQVNIIIFIICCEVPFLAILLQDVHSKWVTLIISLTSFNKKHWAFIFRLRVS